MRPGQRIALITESARLLSAREWSEIDLVLRQHELPTSDMSGIGDGPYGYVMEMIDRARDESQTELHAYLVGESETLPTEAQPWAQGQLKLFSHLAVNQIFAGEVSRALAFEGVNVSLPIPATPPGRASPSPPARRPAALILPRRRR